MNKFFILTFATLIFLSCNNTNPKSVDSDSKEKVLIKTEQELKKEKMQLVEIGQTVPYGKLFSTDSLIVFTSDFRGK